MTNGSHRARLRIAVLFGGRSAEHEVSILSATNVMRALDPEKYELVPIFVTRSGKWILAELEEGSPSTPERGTQACPVPGGGGRMIAIPPAGSSYDLPDIDALFPVLHGLHGEDGSVQGVAEVALVPLVGCGILGSATALDKDITKRLLREAGIANARALAIHRSAPPSFADVEGQLGLPVFIKPARQGSSVGVSKVSTEEEFARALELGFEHDRKLLAEEFIRGREVECSVLEEPGGGLFVSRPGEIVTAGSHAFYDYDAKYLDAEGASVVVPAELRPEVETRIRDMAASAFRALGCDGMARVDFFVTEAMDVLINEVNTIPGFTDISMYPKAMAASGVSYSELIDRLIEHGLARAGRSRP